MRKRSRINWTLIGVLFFSLISFFSTTSFADTSGTTLYESDFSEDPGWITNNPASYYWDSNTQSYYGLQHRRAVEHAYHHIDWDNNSPLKVQVDFMQVSGSYARWVNFCIMDSSMILPAGPSVGENVIQVGSGHDDLGKMFLLSIRESDGTPHLDRKKVPFVYGKYYRWVIEYLPDSGVVTATVRDIETDTIMAELSVSAPSGFEGIDRVGISTNIPGSSYNTTAPSYVDNLTVWGNSPNNLIADAGDNLSISSEDQNITIIQGTATAPGGDPLTYRWLEGQDELSTWQDVGENGEAYLDLSSVPYFSVGGHTLVLEVSNDQTTSSDEMILTVDNSAPHAAPTGGGVYEIYSPIILGGEVSDYDGDFLEYEWSEVLADTFGVTLYESDFSEDPGWITNNPASYYWDSDTQSYYGLQHRRAVEYAYHHIDWDNNSPLKVQFDLKQVSGSYAHWVCFAIMDSNMLLPYWPNFGENGIYVSTGHDDLGQNFHMAIRESDETLQSDRVNTPFEYGKYYRWVIEYLPDPGVVTATVRDLENNTLMAELSISVPSGFEGIDRVGISTNIPGSGYNTTAPSYVDNLTVWSNNYFLFGGEIQAIYGGDPVDLPEHTLDYLSLGTHTLKLSVSDGVNEPVTSSITVEVIDTTAPTLVPVANKLILWPPNHKMVDIVIEANASDNTSGLVNLSATVASNEPEDGLGDGDTAPDWSEPVIDQVNGIISLQLRAERSGSGDGRVYTITITATDEYDNSSQAQVEIVVPHDKRKK